MYPVINLTHMLNILDMFSLGVTILKICLGHTWLNEWGKYASWKDIPIGWELRI